MKRILWALAIIIIPAFVLWGAGSLSKRNLPYSYIGIIDGKKVSVDEFVESIKDVQTGLFLNYFSQPEALDRVQKDRKILNHLAWENLILTKAAKKEGAEVSDKEVIDFITKHPLFTRGGVFDDKLYNYVLKNSLGMTPRTFEESTRRFLTNLKFRDSIIKNVSVSDDEVRNSYKNEFEKAKVNYIVMDKANFVEKIHVSDEEISSFYEQNKARFKEPEKVIVQYIVFPHSEEETKEAVLEGLNSAYAKLKKNSKNMEKIAANLNLTIKETPAFSQEEIISELGDVRDISIISFKLRPVLDILPIINEKDLGNSYIIRVKEKFPPGIKTKVEVSSYIFGILKDEKALALAKEEADKLYGEAESNKMSLRKIAEDHGLKLLETGMISRYDYIEEVGESYNVITAAYNLKIGEFSQPIKIRKGFAIIEPVEFQPIDEKKFEAEKENYTNKVLSIKKIKALDDWFKKAFIVTSLNVDLDKI